MVSAPVLVFNVETSKSDIELHTDASGRRIGAVLMQKGEKGFRPV